MTEVKQSPCPCGGPELYESCCEPLHHGRAVALSAEQLMRSRYAAYSMGEVDYLVATRHASAARKNERDAVTKTVRSTRWLGLEILDRVGGQPGESTGIVEFEARCESPGGIRTLRERSRFLHEDGRWFYVDGDFLEPRPSASSDSGGEP